jgi:hypothetical protein
VRQRSSVVQGTSHTLVAGASGQELASDRSAEEIQAADAESDWHTVLSVQVLVQTPHMQPRAPPQTSSPLQAFRKWVSPPLELSFGSEVQLINALRTKPIEIAKRRTIRRRSFVSIGLPIAFSNQTLPGVYHHTGVRLGDFTLGVESLDALAQLTQFGTNTPE